MSDEDHLYGFSTDDDDSSDEEVIAEDAIDVEKLPTIAKDDATVQKKLERTKRQQVRLIRPTTTPAAHRPTETRQGRHRDQSSTTRLLRGPTPGVLFTVRRGIASACVPEQKGLLLSMSVPRSTFHAYVFLDRKVETLCIPRI